MVSYTATRRALPQRARKDEDKEARRRLLLDEARRILARTPYAQVRLAEVAEAAGVAKGTLFLYFPTKEALFLALLDEGLASWFARLEERLAEGGGRWGAERVARAVTDTLRGEEVLERLLPLLNTVLEHNVERAQVEGFKRRLGEHLARAGALLERRLPALGAGEGARVLLHVNALVTGLRQMADEAPVVRAVLDASPELAPLRVDFARELSFALTLYLRGLTAR